ncbi:MAG: UDP-3-O-(3-hydroxymyristoyl)glucosamine N-acyltransferase [Phycisphaerales bacterium]|nr:MAG: UDP-3-O-(3-hydroxymyristoyl)glucosamine N-acyltransferase [Phycisphaerales bacterium]
MSRFEVIAEMRKKLTLAELAKVAGGTVRGPATLPIGGVNTVIDAREDEITWVRGDEFRKKLETSRAGAVVVSPSFGATPMPAVLCEDPELGFLRILERFAPPIPRPPVGIDPAARVAENVTLGGAVAIGPHVVIGERAEIGDRTVLHAGVFVGPDTTVGADCELWAGVVVRERCRLGNRVIIHPNAVIGADGFGYHFTEGRHQKIPQIGSVRIEDDVEIGANSCIDRAKFGVTVIGQGTKIDNLVQVAHNVQIGTHCVLAGQVGLSGSVRLGRYVVLGGQAGVADHIGLGDGVRVAATSLVMRSFPAGKTIGGSPAKEHRDWLREEVQLRRLPEWVAALKDLTRRIERLERAADNQQTS